MEVLAVFLVFSLLFLVFNAFERMYCSKNGHYRRLDYPEICSHCYKRIKIGDKMDGLGKTYILTKEEQEYFRNNRED